MSNMDWDNKFEYLKNTRWLYYNDDYLQFLVERVWKITTKVDMIDFGCGYGYLATKLMPLLPRGSTYTGIDQSSQLIEKAREYFGHNNDSIKFLLTSIEDYSSKGEFDIALTHGVMLHIEDVESTVSQMMESVKNSGLVICFEPNWIANMSNIYADGMEQSDIVNLEILQKLYENQNRVTHKDGNIGMKLPILMSKLGLESVECRMSDKVNFVDRNADELTRGNLIKSLIEDGLGRRPNELENIMTYFQGLGLSEKEAKDQYDAELSLYKSFRDIEWLTYAPSMKISFGKVEKTVT